MENLPIFTVRVNDKVKVVRNMEVTEEDLAFVKELDEQKKKVREMGFEFRRSQPTPNERKRKRDAAESENAIIHNDDNVIDSGEEFIQGSDEVVQITVETQQYTGYDGDVDDGDVYDGVGDEGLLEVDSSQFPFHLSQKIFRNRNRSRTYASYREKCIEEQRDWAEIRMRLTQSLTVCTFPSITKSCCFQSCINDSNFICLSCHHQHLPSNSFCTEHVESHTGLGHCLVNANDLKSVTTPSNLSISCGCDSVGESHTVVVAYSLSGSQNVNVMHCVNHSLPETLLRNSLMGCHPKKPGKEFRRIKKLNLIILQTLHFQLR
jgi:hypothetical protein